MAHTVEKIGGTSMSDYRAVRDNIVLRRPPGSTLYGRILVVSAYGGITNKLLEHKKSGQPGVFALFASGIEDKSWLRALTDWRGKGPPREPMAWLTTVASNVLASYYRRRKPHLHLNAESFVDERTTTIESPEIAAALYIALEKLRPRQARLIEAFHFDGKALAEIADELGISERAAEGRVKRAREALKARLGLC